MIRSFKDQSCSEWNCSFQHFYVIKPKENRFFHVLGKGHVYDITINVCVWRWVLLQNDKGGSERGSGVSLACVWGEKVGSEHFGEIVDGRLLSLNSTKNQYSRGETVFSILLLPKNYFLILVTVLAYFCFKTSFLTVVTLSHRIKKCPLKYSHLFCGFWRIYEFFSKFQKYKSRIISMQYFGE